MYDDELTYEHEGVPVCIMQDDDPSGVNPRENTNVGTFLHWHRRYTLGDGQISGTLDDAMERGGLRMLRRYLTLFEGATVVLPVGMLDHSGISLWVGGGTHWSDAAGWDSGTVGVIYDTPESREETGVPLDKVEEALRSEIDEYDKYVRGEVYGFVVGEGRVEESCFGIIGLDWAKKEAEMCAAAIAGDYRRLKQTEAACRFDPETLGVAVEA